MMVSPNPSHPFNLVSYATKDIIVAILVQKNIKGHENPISFMSTTLKGAKLNYTLVEKYVYDVIKGLEHFKSIFDSYLFKVHIPFPSIKDILTQ